MTLEFASTRFPASQVPQRPMLLLHGPLDAVTEVVTAFYRYQLPNLWWPDDRAWCVATEIDFRTTYLGGSRSCMDAVVAHRDLEALPVDLRDGIGITGDLVNPSPDNP